ncbi:type II toxin-antitoxin system VapC family toxin [Moorella naiadis]|uniref:type II toxin-antitoxin system VapC family toxin n=1 Tax=Moorella naiadis (nom. illeg.) TaxID=3093670 RepID=UPI003D9C8D52
MGVKESVYLDTSVPSAYYDSRDPKRQELTRELWLKLQGYRVYISPLVLEELGNVFNTDLKAMLLTLVDGFEVLALNDEVLSLAGKYVAEGIIPAKYEDDAYHIAVASVNGIDYLISWNFRHLVKVKTRRLVNLVNLKEGYKPIEIIAPPEL